MSIGWVEDMAMTVRRIGIPVEEIIANRVEGIESIAKNQTVNMRMEAVGDIMTVRIVGHVKRYVSAINLLSSPATRNSSP
jgi:hypothetical protein